MSRPGSSLVVTTDRRAAVVCQPSGCPGACRDVRPGGACPDFRGRRAFAFHRRFAFLNFPADFEGKDPDDPEFQATRDYLHEKRRKREARKKAKKKGKKRSQSQAPGP